MIKGKSPKRDIRLILDNIRSVHNVGSIFRTADTLGISKIYCVNTTPTPVDRFNAKRKDFSKVSLGAEETILWEHIVDVNGLISNLKKEGFSIVALEQDSKSVDYKDVVVEDKTAIILGNEVEGVSKELLEECDVIAEIPLVGKKESLNVSVSTGIFLYRLLDC
jgi:tRNA G18 (ribose-2'-O)-methylase SpoU